MGRAGYAGRRRTHGRSARATRTSRALLDHRCSSCVASSPRNLAVAGGFTCFLIERFGWDGYREYYRRADRERFRSRWEEQFGMSLESAWQTWGAPLAKKTVSTIGDGPPWGVDDPWLDASPNPRIPAKSSRISATESKSYPAASKPPPIDDLEPADGSPAWKSTSWSQARVLAGLTAVGLLLFIASIYGTLSRSASWHDDLQAGFSRSLPFSDEASNGDSRTSTTRPSPSSTRLSALIPRTPTRTPIAASPGEKRRNTTSPSPTSPRAIRVGRDDFFAYYHRGIAWDLKKDYDLAVADFSEAIQLRPLDARSNIARGDMFFRMKQYDKALADYNDTIQFGFGEYRRRAAVWRAKGEEHKAIADEKTALKLESRWLTRPGNEPGSSALSCTRVNAAACFASSSLLCVSAVAETTRSEPAGAAAAFAGPRPHRNQRHADWSAQATAQPPLTSVRQD